MLQVKNVKVYDLKESVIACRNAMRTDLPEYTEEEFQASFKRAIKLVQASKKDEKVKCHDNFLTGIRVSFDLIYPQYITPELQRYHWIDIVTSASKMHKLMSRPVDVACNKYVTKEAIQSLQCYIDIYNDLLEMKKQGTFNGWIFYTRYGERIEDLEIDEALYHARIFAMSNCPMGYELFERVSTNYKQLQTIYWQRVNHRLKEDWGSFCEFILSLPYANEFILGKEPDNEKL